MPDDLDSYRNGTLETVYSKLEKIAVHFRNILAGMITHPLINATDKFVEVITDIEQDKRTKFLIIYKNSYRLLAMYLAKHENDLINNLDTDTVDVILSSIVNEMLIDTLSQNLIHGIVEQDIISANTIIKRDSESLLNTIYDVRKFFTKQYHQE